MPPLSRGSNTEKLTISISGNITISSLEELILINYRKSLSVSIVVFDLTNIVNIGFFQATLFLSWVATLVKKKSKPITIKLPNEFNMKAQVRKILFDGGILQCLSEMGVRIPQWTYRASNFGLPVNIISSNEQEIWPSLQGAAERLSRQVGLSDFETDDLKDIFDVILFELVENATIHANNALPHYGINLARASGAPARAQGFVSTYDRGIQYLDLCIGDIGAGIETNIKPLMIPDYEPPFRTSHNFTQFEKVLAYAFEFTTTSNINRRRQKLSELIKNSTVDPSQIATGLYCVLAIARSRGGQLILRTPHALISFDFYPERNFPTIKGHKELGVKRLGSLPGTHYFLRIPLIDLPSQRVSIQSDLPTLRSIPIKVIDAFASTSQSEPLDLSLHSAISMIDEYLIRNRMKDTITVILPPQIPLPSRAEALFLAAVQGMNHGHCRILWLHKRASSILRNIQNGTSSLISRPWMLKQSILVGNLKENIFARVGYSDDRWNGLVNISEDNEKIILEPRIQKMINQSCLEQLVKDLHLILDRKEVRHTGAPFLIERQYYTDRFFHVARAFEKQADLEKFSEWALAHIPSSVDVLIAANSVVMPLAEIVAVNLSKYHKRKIAIIQHDPTGPLGKTLAQTVQHTNRHAVIITDVICRGNSIQELLSVITGVEIDRILSVIDGRSQETHKPFVWNHRGERKFLDVYAPLVEPIPTHHQPPMAGSEYTDTEEERLYVIDRITHSPTLYVRPAKPKIGLDEILSRHVQESKSLFVGHSEHMGKHYSFFLNLPNLFISLKNQIEKWVTDQIQYVHQASDDSWFSYLYDIDGSLTWIADFISTLPHKISVRKLSIEELRAPKPPTKKDPSGNCLVILPAIASGETTRLCIEYVSRHNPASILILCVASRMDPYNLTFYTGITRYRGAAFRLACFLDFPISAFMPSQCPQCKESIGLEHILNLVKKIKHDDCILAEALKARISASKSVPLGEEGQENLMNTLSEHDFQRAYIRALYEASAVDHVFARRELNQKLKEDRDSIDRFLEILSAEHFHEQFSKDELTYRLFKAEPDVYSRIIEIITSATPSFPISHVVGAAIHLAPQVFIANAINLLSRFADSLRDVEAICIGLLQLDVKPPDAAELFSETQGNIRPEIKAIFRETLDILDRRKEEERMKFNDSIEATCKLWAQLARSSQFFVPLDRLVEISYEDTNWNETTKTVEVIWKAWRGEIAELVYRIQSGPLWPQLIKRHIHLAQFLSKLDRSVALLAQWAKTSPDLSYSEERIFSRIQISASEALESSKEVAVRLHSFFINASGCAAANLKGDLVADDGRLIHVQTDVDYHVPLIFCAEEDLEFICGELIGNWRKHNKQLWDGNVLFKLFEEGKNVVLEFVDNFNGDFDLQSYGGLGKVRDICIAYGGAIKVTPVSEGQKALRLFFTKVSGVTRQTQMTNHVEMLSEEITNPDFHTLN